MEYGAKHGGGQSGTLVRSRFALTELRGEYHMRNVTTLIDHGATIWPDEGKAAYRWPRLALVGRLWSASGTLAVVVCLSVVLGTLAVTAFAAEQRCGQLGGNCVCSEPFNTTVLVKVSGSWYNPGDSTSQECTTEGIPGGVITRNASDVFGDSDATAMAALPPGSTIQHFVRGPEGHLGTFYAGQTFGSQYVKRAAARWYLYHSPNFQFAQEGICTNSKLAAFTGPNSLLDKSFGYVHMYNFFASDGWSPGQDCCLSGPGPDENAIQKADWRGQWWRLEVIYTNRAGPGWRLQLYAKNVTTNGPEYLIVDTAASGTRLRNDGGITPPKRQDIIWMNNYRETGCTGWLGFSHYLAAGWDTDEGQRIGAAVEIESGGALPLGAPSGLSVR